MPPGSGRGPPPARQETLHTPTFWLITFIFSTVDIGIASFKLHVLAYISDLGHSMVAAASVATVMAATQLGSGLLWGFISEWVSVRRATALMFVVQAVGLVLVRVYVQLFVLLRQHRRQRRRCGTRPTRSHARTFDMGV